MYRYLIILLLLTGSSLLCKAQADKKVSMCNGDTATMWASVAGADSVQWYTSPDNEPIAGANNDTFVTLKGGIYYMIAFTDSGNCSAVSDNIEVDILVPQAQDDHYVLSPGRTEAFNILANDMAPCSDFDLSSIRIVKMPMRGVLMSIAAGRVSYKASGNVLESDEFSYMLKDMQGHWTNIATVRIDIDLSCAIVYPNPVQNDLNIVVDPKAVHAINMYDAAGRFLKTIPVGNGTIKVDMGPFSQGAYMFEMEKSATSNCTMKVIKSKN